MKEKNKNASKKTSNELGLFLTVSMESIYVCSRSQYMPEDLGWMILTNVRVRQSILWVMTTNVDD